MTEIGFPVLGAAFVVLFVLPAFALLAKIGLVISERRAARGALDALDLRYVLLTGSTALPLAWIVSAALHQAETGSAALACLFKHNKAELCLEPGCFLVVLAATVLAFGCRAIRKQRGPSESSTDDARVLLERVRRIISSQPSLTCLDRRVAVTDDRGFALGTQGWLSPRVFIGMAFAGQLSDEMLAGALGHEAEHVRDCDPLRYFILQLVLGMNPFGRLLLAPHLARWLGAREAHCDREAVIRGAAPLSLADAIVKAARPSLNEGIALGARDTAALKFRVGMLVAFSECRPVRCSQLRSSASPLALALLLVALFLPHETGTAALDALHSGTEHALTSLWH